MSALAIATLNIARHDSLSVVPAKPPRKKTYNEEGYVRIWHGPDRGKYEHRIVMRDTLQNERICFVLPPIDPKSGLPYGMVVHHINHVRDDNRPENLMLLDVAIHDAISPCKTRTREGERLSSRLRLPPPKNDEDDECVAIQNEHSFSEIDAVKFWEDLNQDKPIRRPVDLIVSVPKVRAAIA